MPIVTKTAETLLASCNDALCSGYEQQPVDGVAELIEFTFGELSGGGGSDPRSALIATAVERSTERFAFADESDRPCPSCGADRIIDRQTRPVYPRATRQSPDELLVIQGRIQRQTHDSAREAELMALRAELAQSRTEMAELRMKVNGHNEPAPAPRPRKVTPRTGDAA